MDNSLTPSSYPPAHRMPPSDLVHYRRPGAPPNQSGESFGLREILSIGFKHKYKILVLFLLGLVASPIVYKSMPRVYESKAYLMVKFGWEYMYSPELAMEGQSPSPYARNEVINSEIQILDSRDLKERVIKTVGVQNIYPELSEDQAKPDSKGLSASNLALVAFEKNFFVTPVRNSSVIEVSFQGKNPQITAEVLNKLIYFYGVKRLEIFKDPKSLLFLEKKVAEYREDLRKAEDELESYKQTNQVFSLAEQLTLLLGQRAGIEDSLLSNQNRHKELQEKLSSLEKQIKTLSQTSPTGATAAEATTTPNGQLLALQLKEQELLTKYRENNRLVQEVRDQIRLVQENLKTAPKGSSSPGVEANEVYQEVQKEIIKTKAELSSLQTTDNSLRKQMEETNRRVQALDLKEKKLRELLRERDTTERNYQTAAKKLEEARVFDDMDRQKMTSVSVIQPAEVPLKPIKPNKSLPIFLLMGACLGLGGGCGLAYVMEATSQQMTTPHDAEKRLNLPVLVTVPDKEF